ncbi:MAG: helix-turn-helix domain-containing protein [Pirellulales bacterium]|nr:helix-turn-helix domain-containing protein [Pirellulales bacterium]
MPNIASILKDEIRRLAKREIKVEIGKTKRAVLQCRREIAQLKRCLVVQTKTIAALQKHLACPAAPAAEEAGEKPRFSARSVKAQRTRLGFSALDYGKLVGVSPLTIYAWEQGKSRPRKAQLASLAAVRGIGKREARQRIGLNGIAVAEEN